MELLSFYFICNFLLTILLLLMIFYYYAKYKLSYWTRFGIEQLPNPHLIFGHIKDAILFRNAPGYHIGQLHQTAPDLPFVGFYIFHKPCLLIRDPELAQKMLVTDVETFIDRHFSGSTQVDSIGMLNLFGLRNPLWKFLRTKLSPIFSRATLKKIFPKMVNASEPMVQYLRENKLKENGMKQLDFQDLSYKYGADLISSIALGTKTDSFHNPDTDYTKEVLNLYHGNHRMIALFIVFFIPEILKYGASVFLLNLKYSKKLFWKAVQSRENGQTRRRGDIIDILLNLKRNPQTSFYKFEGNNLFDQAGHFFSGMESSSLSTSFTLLKLAKNPKYQALVREEILHTIGKYGWTMEAFDKMNYLELCIYEAIRIHPPVSFIDREANNEYNIPNTDIILEKGTPVFVSFYGMHYDETLFPEPEIYNPGRFEHNKNPIGFMGFGIGLRKCTGLCISMLHLKLAISQILINFKISVPADDGFQLDSRHTFSMAARGIDINYAPIVH